MFKGPYVIVRRVGEVDYAIQLCNGKSKKEEIVHQRRFKLAHTEEDVENEVITDEQMDEGNQERNNEPNGNENTSDSDSVEDWTQIEIQPRINRGNKLLSDNAQARPPIEQQAKRLNDVNKRTTRSTEKDK